MTDEDLEAFGATRRDFFKKMLALGFAVPVISSFALDGVASAGEWPPSYGNQTYGNQSNFGDHDHDDRHRHHFPNQYHPNQRWLG